MGVHTGFDKNTFNRLRIHMFMLANVEIRTFDLSVCFPYNSRHLHRTADSENGAFGGDFFRLPSVHSDSFPTVDTVLKYHQYTMQNTRSSSAFGIL